jgi:hypothetical protein
MRLETPRPETIAVHLAPDVHGVMIDDDAVFLDVAANVYFCLPAVGAVLALQHGRAQAVPALAEALRQGGLAQDAVPEAEAGPWSATPPRRTARALIAQRRPAKTHMRHLRAIMAGVISAARPASLQALLPPRPGAPAGLVSADPPSGALLDDLAVFRSIVPWLPVDGTCLFRSGMLRVYLAALGHPVDWVFAVRTWPFRAHCWLQAGDVALDDEAERVIAYHAIMVR